MGPTDQYSDRTPLSSRPAVPDLVTGPDHGSGHQVGPTHDTKSIKSAQEFSKFPTPLYHHTPYPFPHFSFLSFHSSGPRKTHTERGCCLTPATIERFGWWVPLGPAQDQPLPSRSPKVPLHDGWSGLLKVAHLGPTVSKNGITPYSVLGFNSWVFTTWIVAPP